MKTTLKIFPLMLGIMLFFTQCEKEVLESEMITKSGAVVMDLHDGCTVTQTLWAGAGQNNTANGTDVGTVTATVNGKMLNVIYDVVYPWYGIEYHLWVGKAITDIPKNAAPGQFPFSGHASYSINLEELGFLPGNNIYISAHAVVAEGIGREGLETRLPETSKFSIVLNRVNTYLTTTITEGNILNGVYGSYCIQSGTFITQNTMYDAKVYSSYALPVDFTKVNKPENFPKVNWIINNITVGSYYTYEDVQRAIWELLENTPASIANPPLNFDPIKVAEILAAADGDFIPGCGQQLVIVLDPITSVQPVIIWKPVPCGGEETAWAFGQHAFNQNKVANRWGWIFNMTYCE